MYYNCLSWWKVFNIFDPNVYYIMIMHTICNICLTPIIYYSLGAIISVILYVSLLGKHLCPSFFCWNFSMFYKYGLFIKPVFLNRKKWHNVFFCCCFKIIILHGILMFMYCHSVESLRESLINVRHKYANK